MQHRLAPLLLTVLTGHLAAAASLYIEAGCNPIFCLMNHGYSYWHYDDGTIKGGIDSNNGCHKTGPFQDENSEFCMDWTVDGGRGHYRFPWMAKPRCLSVGHREPRDCPGAKDGWDCYYWVLNDIECTWWTGDP